MTNAASIDAHLSYGERHADRCHPPPGAHPERHGGEDRHQARDEAPETALAAHPDRVARRRYYGRVEAMEWAEDNGDDYIFGLAGKDGGLVDGRRLFRHGKTGAVVAIRETPQFTGRLEAARTRVAEIALKLGWRKKSDRRLSSSTKPPAEVGIAPPTAMNLRECARSRPALRMKKQLPKRVQRGATIPSPIAASHRANLSRTNTTKISATRPSRGWRAPAPRCRRSRPSRAIASRRYTRS